jgi:uncharacterized protein YbaA (DUF1428 family)
VSDDMSTTNDSRTFNQAADTKGDELVVFAWIVYPSRESRDTILAQVFADPRLQDNDEMPFDMKRMAHAGFKPLVAFNKN